MAKAKLVTGLFKSKIAAESAVDAILKRGFTRDDISVLMSDATRSKEFALQTRCSQPLQPWERRCFYRELIS
jgi:hypothetical protein